MASRAPLAPSAATGHSRAQTDVHRTLSRSSLLLSGIIMRFVFLTRVLPRAVGRLVTAPAIASMCAIALRAQTPVLTVQQSGTTALLQAVSVSTRDPQTVWISGHAGTYVVTTDGGASWRARVVPGYETLQFRDLHAIDANRAWLMSAGNGSSSGIFRTTDGGNVWTPVFVNRDTAAFYDCMAFFDDTHGFAFSDAVNALTPIVRTTNGSDWTLSTMPSLPGEGGFAASGLCAITSRDGDAWIATGAGATPRVRRSVDRGRTWTDAVVPLAAGPSAGATSVAFRDRTHGVVMGGVIGGTGSGPRAARTDDGGATWTVVSDPPFAGAVFGAAYALTRRGAVLVAVGPGGAHSRAMTARLGRCSTRSRTGAWGSAHRARAGWPDPKGASFGSTGAERATLRGDRPADAPRTCRPPYRPSPARMTSSARTACPPTRRVSCIRRCSP
jgi:photosystem II stability/assembly factor-like uncharacterized protein